jgi:hypothetical protein
MNNREIAQLVQFVSIAHPGGMMRGKALYRTKTGTIKIMNSSRNDDERQ